MGSYGEDENPDSKSLEKHQTGIELNGKISLSGLEKKKSTKSFIE